MNDKDSSMGAMKAFCWGRQKLHSEINLFLYAQKRYLEQIHKDYSFGWYYCIKGTFELYEMHLEPDNVTNPSDMNFKGWTANKMCTNSASENVQEDVVSTSSPRIKLAWKEHWLQCLTVSFALHPVELTYTWN